MVGLHVLDHQVIRLTARQGFVDVFEPLGSLLLVDGVHDGHLLVQNHIGVVAHAVGHDVLSLKEVYLVVVGADVDDGIRDFFQHFHSSFTAFIQGWAKNSQLELL